MMEPKMRAELIFVLLFTPVVRGAPPATDPTVDWLMQQTTTAPASQPSTPPAAVFKTDDGMARAGVVKLSDGRSLAGQIQTTAERPVRVWVEKEKDYEDIPFEMIRSIDATVVWERDEPEWRFKASGSDIKEYSGKTYPARETTYTFALLNGQTIEGSVVAPLYVSSGAMSETFVLHKRDKGEAGQKLGQLVYVVSVRFTEAATQPGR